jgi:hypothetical protein
MTVLDGCVSGSNLCSQRREQVCLSADRSCKQRNMLHTCVVCAVPNPLIHVYKGITVDWSDRPAMAETECGLVHVENM